LQVANGRNETMTKVRYAAFFYPHTRVTN